MRRSSATALLVAGLASVVLSTTVPAQAAGAASVPTVSPTAQAGTGTITSFTPTVANPTTATKAELDAATAKSVKSGQMFLTPQAQTATADSSTGGQITRSEVIARAKTWAEAGVPYSMSSYRSDANGRYRTDCSGFVSMAWHLASSSANNYGETTGTLLDFTSSISKESLKPGDILLNPESGANGHVVIFNGWANADHTQYDAYEESGSVGAVHREIPYPYFSGHGTFSPRRYDKIVEDVQLSNSQTLGADFNGDGQADIVARDGSGNLKVWTHNAGGYFNAPVTVTSGWNFTQTVAADFDGDGKADLIARDGSGNLKRWNGRGDGTFGAPVQVTGGWDFTQTAAADFDGDGKADLIARDGSGNLKIWAGHGDGTFGAAAQLSSGWDFTQTAAADFNGDHQADLVARDGSGNLRMWTHNAGGYFNAPVTVTGGWTFSQTTAADFDGNGKADLIARDDNTGNLNIWAGRGDTTFAAASKLTSGW
ncbi:FG-GAP-like repeat-containing protein [Streptomyces sp. NPDC088097]|uniref:C40 family peptidase n=1 Tax=Streptomyces sp. NPDC088097 TaxID=3365823 RepID=UPI00382CFF34